MQPTVCTTNKMVAHDAAPVDAAQVAVPTRPKMATQERPKRRQKKMPAQVYYPFWFGGTASSMAACVTHPLDLGIPLSAYKLCQ
jgi:type IV pilus biogenesis protein CpaD/CtpE